MSSETELEAKGLVERKTGGCKINEVIQCPQWLCTNILGLFVDVELYCQWPDEKEVIERIRKVEATIVKQSSVLVLEPHATTPLAFREVDEQKNGEDLSSATGDLDRLKRDHNDTCYGNANFSRATNGGDIYNRIKSMV